MILIAHRGNTTGPNPTLENDPSYIDKAISKGYNVEIDLWYEDSKLYLGHDSPQYEVSLEWIYERASELWIHCKNLDAVTYFWNENINTKVFNFFWHEEDAVTLTSSHYIWAYPGNQPLEGSIAVMPELYDDQVTVCEGICSDYIEEYSK